MPDMVNGIGTAYYGKENWLQRQGLCEDCGNWGVMDSYDTREFFALIFVPIIPMQKKRVLDDCRRCRKHRVMKLSEWIEGREEGLLEAKAEYNRNRNSESAQNLVGSCIAWQSPETLRDNRSSLENTFSSSAENLALLGSAYQYFGEFDEARGFFRKAIQIQPDQGEARESLAFLEIISGQPEDAHRNMDGILRNPQENAWLILLLADAYLAKGSAMNSLQLLQELEQRFPEISKEREFKQLLMWSKKVSEGGKGPFKPITPTLAGGKTAAQSKPKKPVMGSKAPFFIAPALILLALGGFSLYSLFLKGNRKLVLANGWSQKYSVTVNGENHILLPESVRSIRVPEGPLDIVPGPDAPSLDPVSAEITGTFFGRVFDGKTYAVNPDRLAVFVRDQVEYAVNPDPDKVLPYTIHVGESFMTLPEADYHFEEYPEEIDLPSGQNTEVKSRIIMLRGWAKEDLLGEILSQNEDAAIQFATLHLQYGEEEALMWDWLASYLMPEDLRPIITHRLEADPLDLEGHRIFQDSGVGTEVQPNLEEEYRALLKEDSESADRMYLLARVMMDQEESRKMLLKATRGPSPQPYAFHALGHEHLQRGDLKEAVAWFVLGADLDPDNLVHMENLRTGWKITQDYESLAEAYRSDLKSDPLNVEAMTNLLATEVLMGADKVQVKEQVKKMARAIPKDGSWGEVSEWKDMLSSSQDYLLLSPDELAAAPLAEEYHFTKAQLAMITGDHVRAARLMRKEKVDDPYSWLVLYGLEMSQGAGEEAGDSLDRALTLLDVSWPDAYLLLAAEEAPDLEDWKNLKLPPNLKAILCMAAGFRFPETKRELHLLAQRLNFEPVYPQREVARLIGLQ